MPWCCVIISDSLPCNFLLNYLIVKIRQQSAPVCFRNPGVSCLIWDLSFPVLQKMSQAHIAVQAPCLTCLLMTTIEFFPCVYCHYQLFFWLLNSSILFQWKYDLLYRSTLTLIAKCVICTVSNFKYVCLVFFSVRVIPCCVVAAIRLANLGSSGSAVRWGTYERESSLELHNSASDCLRFASQQASSKEFCFLEETRHISITSSVLVVAPNGRQCRKSLSTKYSSSKNYFENFSTLLNSFKNIYKYIIITKKLNQIFWWHWKLGDKFLKRNKDSYK